MNKVYDVKITDTAWEHLVEHSRFIAGVSINAATKLVDDFLESSKSLELMPERCPWLTHDAIPFQKYRKIFIGDYHMALFQVQGNKVYINAVIDCRQDYGWLLKT
ncbi:MAG: type II toxin-antitoxin system RelE/ParE family toxin [Oscillospiraceae bacterium]|nr:type II toxin-antitoxin system RelE/ParE family toxin [Oscillospiraceae bacterium]